MKTRCFLILMLATTLFCSCDKRNTPEKTLRSFVDLRFAGVKSRNKILSYLDGQLYANVENMSDEEFEAYCDSSRVKKSSFKIDLSKCDESECHLTYTIGYKVKETDKVEHKVEVKKIAELERSNSEWKIVSISNVKSYISAEGINLPVK